MINEGILVKTRYCLIALLALSSLAQASSNQSSEQAPGTIRNITQGDMRVCFYEHPYPASIVGLFGFKSGERDKNAVHPIETTYIDAQDTVKLFNENIIGISLPAWNKPHPDTYLIDQQHAYTLTFNQDGNRILTTTENGKIKEPITFEEKMSMAHLVRLAQLDIETYNTINSSKESIARYQFYRNQYPTEAFEIEKEHGFHQGTNMDGYLEIESSSHLQTIDNSQTEKSTEDEVEETEYTVEEAD